MPTKKTDSTPPSVSELCQQSGFNLSEDKPPSFADLDAAHQLVEQMWTVLKTLSVQESQEDTRQQQQSSLKKLLGADDYSFVKQGLELIEALDDPDMIAHFAEGISIGDTGKVLYQQSTIAAWVLFPFQLDVALFLARRTGLLDSLEVLDLSNSMVQDLSQIKGLTSLTELRIANCHELKDISILETLPNLQNLTYANEWIYTKTDLPERHDVDSWYEKSIDRLFHLPKTVSLDALVTLRLPNLSRLNISHMKHNNFKLNTLTVFPKLVEQLGKSVSIGEDGVFNMTEDVTECFPVENQPTIAFIAVSHQGLLDETTHLVLNKVDDLSPLANLRNLISLDLSGCETVIEDISPLQGLVQLQHLNLSRCNKISDLSALNALKELRSLDLSEWRKTLDLSPLHGLPKLTSLNLDSFGLNAGYHTIKLRNLPCLESLNLRYNNNATITLTKIPKLQTLDISSTSVQNLDFLKSVKTLRSLHAYRCHNLSDINGLAGSTQLRLLELGLCYELKYLKQINVLKKLEHLEYLDVSSTGLKSLKPISSLKNLQTLRVVKCKKLPSVAELQKLTSATIVDKKE